MMTLHPTHSEASLQKCTKYESYQKVRHWAFLVNSGFHKSSSKTNCHSPPCSLVQCIHICKHSINCILEPHSMALKTVGFLSMYVVSNEPLNPLPLCTPCNRYVQHTVNSTRMNASFSVTFSKRSSSPRIVPGGLQFGFMTTEWLMLLKRLRATLWKPILLLPDIFNLDLAHCLQTSCRWFCIAEQGFTWTIFLHRYSVVHSHEGSPCMDVCQCCVDIGSRDWYAFSTLGFNKGYNVL